LCHDKIDPLGFSLESYDAAGGYLLSNADQNDHKIDTSGKLPSGETFANIDGLKQILMTSQKRAVTQNIVSQLLSYGLCRKLEYYDQPTVTAIVDRMCMDDQGRYRQLIHEIVNSLPFREATFQGEEN
jgi:hypothetical protein